MSFLTKSAATKGSPLPVTLSKASLAAVPAISADTFFSDVSNWSHVSMSFKNAEGQKKTIVFDANQANPNTTFKSSAKARSGFEVQSVTIYDVDGGSKVLSRAQLISDSVVIADLDVSFEVSGFGLTVSMVGLDQLQFNWNDMGSPVTSYQIYYSNDGGVSWNPQNGGDSETTTVSPFVNNGQERQYKVVSYDDSFNQIGESSPVTFKALASNGQLNGGVDPNNGSVSAITSSSMHIGIVIDGSDGADQYKLEWGYSLGNYTVGSQTFAADANAYSTEFDITGLTGPVYFKLTGSNAYATYSKVTGPINLAVSFALPTPTNVQGTTVGGDVTLTWDAVSGANQYGVYRDGGMIAITDSSTLTYTDTGLAGATYSYTVQAISGGDTSDFSAPVNIAVAGIVSHFLRDFSSSDSIPSDETSASSGITVNPYSSVEIAIGGSYVIPHVNALAAIPLVDGTTYTLRILLNEALTDQAFMNTSNIGGVSLSGEIISYTTLIPFTYSSAAGSNADRLEITPTINNGVVKIQNIEIYE